MMRIGTGVLILFWAVAPAQAQRIDQLDRPMHFVKQFAGDQRLRFDTAGRVLAPRGARLKYRLIVREQDWKKVWGYLYDQTLKVDFRRHHVLAIYASPAKGKYEIKPARVFHFEGKLKVETDVTWTGSMATGHPFLFLVVDPFRTLEVEEHFTSPPNRPVRYP